MSVSNMMHRRSYSDPGKVESEHEDVSDDESVASSSVNLKDLTNWSMPNLSLAVSIPWWLVALVTILVFR